jgi:hypothetical protein
MTFALDVRGRIIQAGQQVVRGFTLNRAGSVGLEVLQVTLVKDGKVYLNESQVPIKFPERLAVLG